MEAHLYPEIRYHRRHLSQPLVYQRESCADCHCPWNLEEISGQRGHWDHNDQTWLECQRVVDLPLQVGVKKPSRDSAGYSLGGASKRSSMWVLNPAMIVSASF